MSDTDEPVDLAAYRAAREEREATRRRREARDKFTAFTVDYGRVIPPPINPDIAAMVDTVDACYVDLGQWIVRFQDEVTALVDAGKLRSSECERLLNHYRELQGAVDAAVTDRPQGRPGDRADDFADTGRWNTSAVNRFADHAKYVYSVGARDVAALQYIIAELGHTGRLNFQAHKDLQQTHCMAMWETLYFGTLSALHDQHTWDGAWDWYDNTYSDGRQVMVQVRMNNWLELERNWPYDKGMSGDGPIVEHPRGSLCQIFPAVIPETDGYSHPWIEIDLEELIDQLGPPPAGHAEGHA